MRHELEQELLNEYTKKFEAYIRVCHLMEKLDNEIYQLALKRASGLKMMMDYLSDHNVLPEQTVS